MTEVSVNKDIIEELLDFKMRYLNDEIQKILSKWNYRHSETFLDDARNGTLCEAEDDAISLHQLIKKRDELIELKTSWS